MLEDRIAIADLIQQWGLYRDQCHWDKLADTFHPDGTIEISWYRGSFHGFIKGSIEMAQKNNLLKHQFGVPVIKIKGDRAISEVSFTILIRAEKGPLELDSTTYARFLDKFEKREGVWKIIERKAVFEKDRIDSVRPSFVFWLATLFTKFKKYPAPYRYTAFVYDKGGVELADRIYVDGSDETMALYKSQSQWLKEKG